MSLCALTCERDLRTCCSMVQTRFDFCQLICANHNNIMSVVDTNNNTGTFWLAMIGSKKIVRLPSSAKLQHTISLSHSCQ